MALMARSLWPVISRDGRDGREVAGMNRSKRQAVDIERTPVDPRGCRAACTTGRMKVILP
jgi:hypothetical protein